MDGLDGCVGSVDVSEKLQIWHNPRECVYQSWTSQTGATTRSHHVFSTLPPPPTHHTLIHSFLSFFHSKQKFTKNHIIFKSQ